MRPISLLVILCVAESLSMASFANFAVLLPEFKVLWSLSNTEAGWIGGIYFAGYVFAVPVLVGLTDAVDAKRIYLVSAFIGVIASFAFALFAEGFWTAMLFRFISGVSLAGTYMPGLQILNDRLEEKQRLKAVPWYTGAFGLGSGGSFFLTGQLVEKVDWPVIFSVVGMLQVACVFIVLTAVPSRRKSSSGEGGRRHPLDFRPVFTNFKAMAYIFGYTGHSYELFAFRAWIVTFLVFAAAVSGAAVSRVEIANYVTIFSLVGFPASVIGAHFALRGNRRRLVTVVMTVSFVLGGMLGFLVGIPFLLLVLIAGVYSAVIMADSGSLTAGTVESARNDERGATLAVHSVLGFSGGFLGPLVVGLVLDSTGGQSSYAAWVFACMAIAAGSLVAVILLRAVLARTRTDSGILPPKP
jgi:MFS family permease